MDEDLLKKIKELSEVAVDKCNERIKRRKLGESDEDDDLEDYGVSTVLKRKHGL